MPGESEKIARNRINQSKRDLIDIRDRFKTSSIDLNADLEEIEAKIKADMAATDNVRSNLNEARDIVDVLVDSPLGNSPEEKEEARKNAKILKNSCNELMKSATDLFAELGKLKERVKLLKEKKIDEAKAEITANADEVAYYQGSLAKALNDLDTYLMYNNIKSEKQKEIMTKRNELEKIYANTANMETQLNDLKDAVAIEKYDEVNELIDRARKLKNTISPIYTKNLTASELDQEIETIYHGNEEGDPVVESILIENAIAELERGREGRIHSVAQTLRELTPGKAENILALLNATQIEGINITSKVAGLKAIAQSQDTDDSEIAKTQRATLDEIRNTKKKLENLNQLVSEIKVSPGDSRKKDIYALIAKVDAQMQLIETQRTEVTSIAAARKEKLEERKKALSMKRVEKDVVANTPKEAVTEKIADNQYSKITYWNTLWSNNVSYNEYKPQYKQYIEARNDYKLLTKQCDRLKRKIKKADSEVQRQQLIETFNDRSRQRQDAFQKMKNATKIVEENIRIS